MHLGFWILILDFLFWISSQISLCWISWDFYHGKIIIGCPYVVMYIVFLSPFLSIYRLLSVTCEHTNPIFCRVLPIRVPLLESVYSFLEPTHLVLACFFCYFFRELHIDFFFQFVNLERLCLWYPISLCHSFYLLL